MVKIRAKEAKNIKEKVAGLIGIDKPYAFLLKTRFGIHTFGLKFPIDVLILDDKNRVVKIRRFLKPNSVFLWNPSFNRVLELPQGTVEKKQIKIHNTIDIAVK